MKIGITLAALRPSLWTEATLLADELGFESVWMPEHLVFPVELEGSPIAHEDRPRVAARASPCSRSSHTCPSWPGRPRGFASAPTSTTSACAIRSRSPVLSSLSMFSPADDSTSGSGPAGFGPSGTPWVWISPPGDGGWTRRSRCANVCWSRGRRRAPREFFDFEPVTFVPETHPDTVAAPSLRRRWPRRVSPRRHHRGRLDPAGYTHGPRLPGAVAELAGGDARRPVGPVRSRSASRQRVPTPTTFAASPRPVWRRALVRPWKSSKDALDGMRRFADHILPGIGRLLSTPSLTPWLRL